MAELDESKSTRLYDLEERTFQFAFRVRNFLKKLMRSRANLEDGKQLIRASASVAANYIEASEAISKKDFVFRIKLCRKEAKESALFLKLLDTYESLSHKEEKEYLTREAHELTRIFGAIVSRTK